MEVGEIAEALRIDLIDLFGAGWSCSEPPAVRHDFDAADRFAISRRSRQNLSYWFAGQIAGWDGRGGKFCQSRFLLVCGRRIDPPLYRNTALSCRIRIDLTRIASGAGGHLRRQKGGDDSVLVG